MPHTLKQRKIILFLNNQKVMEGGSIMLIAKGRSRELGFYPCGQKSLLQSCELSHWVIEKKVLSHVDDKSKKKKKKKEQEEDKMTNVKVE